MLGEVHPIQVLVLGAVIVVGVQLSAGRRRGVRELKAAHNRSEARVEALQREVRIVRQGLGPDPINETLNQVTVTAATVATETAVEVMRDNVLRARLEQTES